METISKSKLLKELRRWPWQMAYDFYAESILYETNDSGKSYSVFHTIGTEKMKGRHWRHYLHKITGWTQNELLDELYRREDITDHGDDV